MTSLFISCFLVLSSLALLLSPHICLCQPFQQIRNVSRLSRHLTLLYKSRLFLSRFFFRFFGKKTPSQRERVEIWGTLNFIICPRFGGYAILWIAISFIGTVTPLNHFDMHTKVNEAIIKIEFYSQLYSECMVFSIFENIYNHVKSKILKRICKRETTIWNRLLTRQSNHSKNELFSLLSNVMYFPFLKTLMSY